jgi:hypothetical protein
MDFKNLLMLHYVAGYSPVPEIVYRHIDVAFLLHTMTPFFQLMNQAVIPT